MRIVELNVCNVERTIILPPNIERVKQVATWEKDMTSDRQISSATD